MKRILGLVSGAVVLGVVVRLGLGAAPTTKPSAEGVEYFEKHIRPVLVERCYRCHSKDAEKVKGGLAGFARGVDEGRG